jgi:hypothetical protein
MRRLLLATILAVVIAAPVSAAYGSGSDGSVPAGKAGSSGGAPAAPAAPHGDRDCPFAETPAI